MRFILRKRFIIALAAIAVAIVGVLASGAFSETPQPQPPYNLLPDGAPDVASLPAQVPVLDATGKVVRSVPRACLFSAPDKKLAACPGRVGSVPDSEHIVTETIPTSEVANR